MLLPFHPRCPGAEPRGERCAGRRTLKVGLLLPYTGTFAALGEATSNGMKLAIEQQGGSLGGRPVEYVVVDSEADPGRAVPNMQKLIAGAQVDVVVGPVHSAVGMGAGLIGQHVLKAIDECYSILEARGLSIFCRAVANPYPKPTPSRFWQQKRVMFSRNHLICMVRHQESSSGSTDYKTVVGRGCREAHPQTGTKGYSADNHAAAATCAAL